MATNKQKALITHLTLTLLFIAVYFFVVRTIWYPSPYFEIEKAWEIIIIVSIASMVLGPLLTFAVYKPNKPGLTFDLWVIAAVQLATFIIGSYVTYSHRPVYIAFADSSFSIAIPSKVNQQDITDETLRSSIFSKPKLVYVELPRDAAALKKVTNAFLDQGHLAFTKHYQPFIDNKDQVFASGTDIRALSEKNSGVKTDLDTFLSRQGGTLDDYVYVVIEGRTGFHMLIFNKTTAELVGALVD